MTDTAKTAGIRTLRDGRVGVIVLSQPERRNALTLEMWGELTDAVGELAGDDDVRVVVVRGEGDAAFSGGADISEFPRRRTEPTDVRHYQERVVGAERALLALRKPTIAMLHGACAGGGAGIALSCAVRLADDRLRFSIPAARLGVVYEREIVARLLHEVGPATTLDVLVSARTIDAMEALRVGLVSAVCPVAELEGRVMDYAEQIARNAPLSVLGAWLAIKAAEQPDAPRWAAEFERVRARALESDDYREGVRAFLEKRQPDFVGR